MNRVTKYCSCGRRIYSSTEDTDKCGLCTSGITSDIPRPSSQDNNVTKKCLYGHVSTTSKSFCQKIIRRDGKEEKCGQPLTETEI